MSIKALKEQRFEIFKKLEELRNLANDSEHKWSSEDETNWTAANGDYDRVSRSIDLTERTEELEQQLEEKAETRKLFRENAPEKLREVLPSEEERNDALQGWARQQMGMDLEERHQLACRKCGVDPKREAYQAQLHRGSYDLLRRAIRADQGITPGAVGGFLVPTGFVYELERALLAFGGMRAVSSIIRTETGNDIEWPSTNDTGNVGALLAENTVVPDQDVVFAQTVLSSYKITSKMVKASTEILTDSAFNLAEVLGSLLGERIGRCENQLFTTGTGSSQPAGVVTGATSGKTAASATAITADEVIDLFHSVDPAYRDGRSSVWMMNDSSVAAVRKLVDSDGQFLWQPGMQAGIPDRLYGRSVQINQDVASMATGTKPILYGDFSLFKIRDVREVRVVRLRERFADLDQQGFCAFHRVDSVLLNAGTNPIKFITMA
jgi:HK97 family phage major capsid protein